MANPLGRKVYIPRFSKVYFKDLGLFQIFRQGGSNRLVLLSLLLLNAVLLIVAVVLGSKCAKAKDRSVPVSHSVQLENALKALHSKYGNITEVAEEATKALQTAINNHTQLTKQIELKSIVNDNYQKQVDTLRTEIDNLQSNLTALVGNCGKCRRGWIIFNSSCYFFSYLESANAKKNWAESRADCVGRGADLVVIDSQEEQEFVSNNIKNERRPPTQWENGVWVGLNDVETEGKWLWINNVTEAEQRYWMDGEPNNHGLQGENCGIVSYSANNPWKTRYDGNCEVHKLAWTCEMPQR